MAGSPLGGDEMLKELGIDIEQSSTSEAEDLGNPPGGSGWSYETNDGQPDDLAENVFPSQEDEEHTEDINGIDRGDQFQTNRERHWFLPSLLTGIHRDFLARHRTDWTPFDGSPEASRASINDARNSGSRQVAPLFSGTASWFCEPSTGAVGISQFPGRCLTDRHLALGNEFNEDSSGQMLLEENGVHLSRQNQPEEHYEQSDDDVNGQ